jgi:hypothetical protein
VATSNHEQIVWLVAARTPGQPQYGKDKTYGNQIIYFEAAADEQGRIAVDIEYLVERHELLASRGERAPARIPREYLASSKLIPVDGTLLKKLLGDEVPAGDAADKARRLYDAVDDLMNYDKPEGQPWGRGDALWACDSRFGNCTDFHSVFIGACRDLSIPAKFEMGFPLPERKGGLSLLGKVRARWPMAGGRHFRGRQAPGLEGLLLRQSDGRPCDLYRGPRPRARAAPRGRPGELPDLPLRGDWRPAPRQVRQALSVRGRR